MLFEILPEHFFGKDGLVALAVGIYRLDDIERQPEDAGFFCH